MKFKELKKKTIKDLHKLLKSHREELRALRFSIGSEQEKNVRKMRDVKKDVAKILTILNNNQETGNPTSTKVPEDRQETGNKELKTDKK